jgi:hypothetical protein
MLPTLLFGSSALCTLAPKPTGQVPLRSRRALRLFPSVENDGAVDASTSRAIGAGPSHAAVEASGGGNVAESFTADREDEVSRFSCATMRTCARYDRISNHVPPA